jgi:hypothetical protein
VLDSSSRKSALAAALLAAAALLIAGFSVFYEYRVLGYVGPTLDDTFIHLRFSWNIAHGHGFSFNPGQPLPGTTSPLWVSLFVPFAFWSREFLVVCSLVASALSYAATGVLAYVLAGRLGLTKGLDLVAGALVITNGRVLWAGLSGMETDLFAALSLLAFIVYLGQLQRGRVTWVCGAVFGLASIARPEGYMLFLGALCHYLIVSYTQGGGIRPARLLRSLPWTAVLAYMIIVSPYMIFSMATIHHPLPSTFLAKHTEWGQHRVTYLYYSALYFWLDNPAAAIFLVLAVARTGMLLFRDKIKFLASADGLVAGWALGYFAVSAIITPMPFHFCRYQIPVIPFFILMVVRAAQDIISRAGGLELKGLPATGKAGTAAVIVLLLSGAALGHVGFKGSGIFLRWPVVTTTCAKNIQEMHVDIARWLERATPSDSEVASYDIGAIGYYSERRIIDIVGLVTPEIVPEIRYKGVTVQRSKAVFDFLEQRRADYLVIFPRMFPGMVEDEKVFRPVYQALLDDNQIAADDWKVVYQCFWDRKTKEPASARPGN